MGRVVKDGTTYQDGDLQGFCVKCKEARTFWGTVRLTASSRVFATGPCPECGTEITRVLD